MSVRRYAQGGGAPALQEHHEGYYVSYAQYRQMEIEKGEIHRLYQEQSNDLHGEIERLKSQLAVSEKFRAKNRDHVCDMQRQINERDELIGELEAALLAIAQCEPEGSPAGDIARSELDKHGVNWREPPRDMDDFAATADLPDAAGEQKETYPLNRDECAELGHTPFAVVES